MNKAEEYLIKKGIYERGWGLRKDIRYGKELIELLEAYHQSELGDIVKELEDSDTLDDAIIFFKQKLTK